MEEKNPLIRNIKKALYICYKGVAIMHLEHLNELLIATLLTILFTLLCFSSTQARTIWKIGIEDNSEKEFYYPDLNEFIVDYQIPEDWDSRSSWTDFPKVVYPPELDLEPTEIHIDHDYSEEYRYAVLRIKAKSEANDSQRLIVMKGGKEIGSAKTSARFSIFEFPLGVLQKGQDAENEIILKNKSVSDIYAIFFDYLELENKDEDRDEDGTFDIEELWGDPNRDTDMDGCKDHMDRDTASILLQNHDQSLIKRITLDLMEEEDTDYFFADLVLMDQNSSGPIPEIPMDTFFPYGLFMAKIQIPSMTEMISLKLIYPEPIHPVAKIRLYNGAIGWHEASIEAIDGNCISALIEVEWDRNMESKGPETPVTIIGGLSYPTGAGFDLDEGKCFISSISSQTSRFSLPASILLVFISSLFLIFDTPHGIQNPTKDCKYGLRNLSQSKRCLILFTTLTLILLKISLVYAIIYPDMKISSTPNPVGSGARALGMGGAFIAVTDDATAASWNPGGLLKLKRPEISIVGSYFSGKKEYDTLGIPGDIEDLSRGQKHLNYVSAAIPFVLFQRNVVFSLNYQHLYEFAQDTFYTWRYSPKDPNTGLMAADIQMDSYKRQTGTLNTLSPAFAIQITQTFNLGLTLNFWLRDEIDNYWENINTLQGEGMIPGERIKVDATIYDRYEFSGFNTHMGFFWQPNFRFTLGGVLKTPFNAKIKRETRSIFIEEYPDNPLLYNYENNFDIQDLRLKMPMYYGIGASINLTDHFLMALDISHTQWEHYLLCYPSGERFSPINNRSKDEADIKPTTQIRLGAEYILIYPKLQIPIRGGLFYDPEPASHCVDDFYGIGIGIGLTIAEGFSFDIAYQYRFGTRYQAESMLDEGISSDVKQHSLYSSMIYYF